MVGLLPLLQGKVKSKILQLFEEALHWARMKDQKLQFQSQLMREVQPQQGQKNVQPMMEQAHAIQEMQNTGDPHVDLLQRVTNQLDNLSINLMQGGRVHQP